MKAPSADQEGLFNVVYAGQREFGSDVKYRSLRFIREDGDLWELFQGAVSEHPPVTASLLTPAVVRVTLREARNQKGYSLLEARLSELSFLPGAGQASS